MPLCSSCKNRTSNERCGAKSIGETLFCRRHVKVKQPRIWAIVNNVGPCATLIQKIWRGYSVRNWIKLAGPGALNRILCHNDEELLTLDDKKSVDPFSYFAFEEADKVYWFDVRSIAEHFSKTTTNPYTRQSLTMDTRKRLRKLCQMRYRRKLPHTHNPDICTDLNQVILVHWTTICQIAEENGFYEVNPQIFVSATRAQLYAFLVMISLDMKAWAMNHSSKYSRRHRYYSWVKTILNQYSPSIHPLKVQFLASRVLLNILNDCPQQYDICFIIMSSLYRL